MSEYIYLKFLKELKSKRNRFRLSTERKSIEKWTGATKKIKATSDDAETKRDRKPAKDQSPFYRINSEIFDTFISFYDAVPLFMGIVGFYPDVIAEQYIRETFKKEGELLQENNKSEFYRMDIKFFSKIKKEIEKINAVATVANHSDRFFIIGLVSVFDQFIYNLARAVIEANPEIVFNSERNISYGDIGNYKDIHEIRGHIVDTELETLLRESHEEQLNWFSKKLGMKIEPEESLFSKFVEL